MLIKSTATRLLLLIGSKTNTVYESASNSSFENTTNKQQLEPKWGKLGIGYIIKYSGIDYKHYEIIRILRK